MSSPLARNCHRGVFAFKLSTLQTNIESRICLTPPLNQFVMLQLVGVRINNPSRPIFLIVVFAVAKLNMAGCCLNTKRGRKLFCQEKVTDLECDG